MKKLSAIAACLLALGCASKGVTCQDYLSSESEPVLLQRAADTAKPANLPLATEEVSQCMLNRERMVVVKLRTDGERLRLLGEFCFSAMMQDRMNTFSEFEKQACSMLIFFAQCMQSSSKEETTSPQK